MSIERRYAPSRQVRPSVSTRADGGGPMIVGYASVFYNRSDSGSQYFLATDVVERIRPGAFDRAIREDDVRALFNHDADHILGRNVSGTLRLFTDSKGLRYEIDPPDTNLGRDLMASLARGDISGSSFAFDIVREEYRKDGPLFVRELVELRLFDVGPVTYPAYTGAESDVREVKPLTPQAQRDRDWMDMQLALMDMDIACAE